MLYDIGIVKRRRIISGSDGYFSVPPPAPPATTTWNPSDKHADITLSGGDLVATESAGASAFRSVRSIASHTTGKYFCKFTITEIPNSACNVGFMNAATALSTPPGGADSPGHGAGYNHSGTVTGDNGTFGGFTLATIETYTTGDVISMALDLTAEKVWFRKNSGNWNNDAGADPAAGANGIDVSGAVQGDAFFIACSMLTGAANVGDITLDASGTGAPSGFSPW